MQLVPKNVLIIGDWTGRLAAELENAGAQTRQCGIGELDEELPFAAEEYDCIIHLLGLGTINDLPGALIHMRNALKSGGLMMGSFPGSGSLGGLRGIMLAADRDMPAARMHPLVDRQSGAGLMQRAGFKRQVVDSHSIQVRYSSLSVLIADLRDMGLTNVLQDISPPVGKMGLLYANREFERLSSAEGKLKETFEMLTLTGWK